MATHISRRDFAKATARASLGAVDPRVIKSIKVVETWLDGYKRYTA